jgi:hypothetical protein
MRTASRRLKPALLTVPVFATALALGGCGSEVLANPNKVVGHIILENSGIKVDSVSCPSGVPLKKGHTFTCTVKFRGQTRTVTVQETSTKGNSALLHIIKVS